MIVIIDYGLGNLTSVQNALTKLAIPCQISDQAEVINQATGLILPGVGSAAAGMANLQAKKLDQLICQQALAGKPLLGICLGMQLLFTNSAEANLPQTFTDCLNLIPGQVKKFETNLKVPQIGWNQVTAKSNSKLLTGIKAESYFYFVHSYYCQLTDSNISFGKTNYDQNFCSLIETKNIYGVQFHPEKSSQVGLQLLQNFGRLVC